jgi:hypothetical protein
LLISTLRGNAYSIGVQWAYHTEEGDPLEAANLIKCCEDMPDPRVENLCRHKLIDVVIIAICATIAGSDDWQQIAGFGVDREDWLKGFLELPRGIPSHDTFSARIRNDGPR